MENFGARMPRVVSALACIALIAGACSSGSSSPAASGSAGASGTAAASGSAAASTSAAPTPVPIPPNLPPPAMTAGIGGSVSVIGTWAGSEQDSFTAMVKPFQDATGVTVQYTGTRDINAVLNTGNFPDLAGLPGPGALRDLAKAGSLKPLDDVIDVADYTGNAPAGYADIGRSNGKLYGTFIKSAAKGLIWFDPKNYTAGAPKDWATLAATDKGSAKSLWCIGVESGAASGWPGTDWIEDIVLRQAGPDVYDAWVNGTQKWSSAEIKAAYQTFGDAVKNAYGGSTTVNGTNFGEAGLPLFTTPPGCLLEHQASFITDFYAKAPSAPKAGTDFDFFPMPDIDPKFAGGVTGGGDLFGMFKDTAQAKALIKYLASPYAQSIWVGRGGALSADKRVTNYPDATSKRLGAILAGAKTFRFDGSDNMPGSMSDAFNKSIVKYVSSPDTLDQILKDLDDVQSSAYAK
jgi:alpha-glucoside transport system substrate-binding protein